MNHRIEVTFSHNNEPLIAIGIIEDDRIAELYIHRANGRPHGWQDAEMRKLAREKISSSYPVDRNMQGSQTKKAPQ